MFSESLVRVENRKLFHLVVDLGKQRSQKFQITKSDGLGRRLFHFADQKFANLWIARRETLGVQSEGIGNEDGDLYLSSRISVED